MSDLVATTAVEPPWAAPEVAPEPVREPLRQRGRRGPGPMLSSIMLIVLGLNIVFHSFSAYKKAEHNSEAKV